MGGISPTGENLRGLEVGVMKLFVISDAPIVEQVPFQEPIACSTSHEDMKILFGEIGKNPMVQMYEIEVKTLTHRTTTHTMELL